MDKKRRVTLIKALCLVGGLVFLLLIWWLVSAILRSHNNNLLPSPWEAIGRWAVVLFSPEYASVSWLGIGWTLARLLIGFGISFVLAAILGTLAGLFWPFEAFMKPSVVLTRALPTAAVVLLLGTMFFLRDQALLPYLPSVLVFMVAFPLIYEAFGRGIRSVDSEQRDALDLDGGHRSLLAIVSVLWPDSQDFVILAVVQSLGLSMKVSVMSEIVSPQSGNLGIGLLIKNAYLESDLLNVIAYSLVAVFLIGLIDLGTFFVKKALKKD
jgi:NitT/TauT family transport system permease protein